MSKWVIPEQLLGVPTALHGHARKEVDEIDPRGTNLGVRPIDKGDSVPSQQDVVGTDVGVKQRCPFVSTVRRGGDFGKPFYVRACPGIQAGQFIQCTGIQAERRPAVRPSWKSGGRCRNRRGSQDACECRHSVEDSVQLPGSPGQDRWRSNDVFKNEHHPLICFQRGKEPRGRNGIRQCPGNLGFSPIDLLSTGSARHFIGSYGLHKDPGVIVEGEAGRQRRRISPRLARSGRDRSTQELLDRASHADRDLIPVQSSTGNTCQEGIDRISGTHRTMIALASKSWELLSHLSQYAAGSESLTGAAIGKSITTLQRHSVRRSTRRSERPH